MKDHRKPVPWMMPINMEMKRAVRKDRSLSRNTVLGMHLFQGFSVTCGTRGCGHHAKDSLLLHLGSASKPHSWQNSRPDSIVMSIQVCSRRLVLNFDTPGPCNGDAKLFQCCGRGRRMSILSHVRFKFWPRMSMCSGTPSCQTTVKVKVEKRWKKLNEVEKRWKIFLALNYFSDLAKMTFLLHLPPCTRWSNNQE